jgi:hypothetical protein
VPADLTHVARRQVRAEPSEPPSERRPLRRLADRVTGRRPVRLLSTVALAVLAVAVLVIAALGITPAVLAAVHSSGRPSAARQRTAQPTAPAQSIAPAQSEPAHAARPEPSARPKAAATPGHATAPASTGPAGAADRSRAGEPRPTSSAGSAATGATDRSGTAHPSSRAEGPETDPAAVLRQLADRRAEAFAANRPDLLAAVYQSPDLLAQDLRQLSSRVPAGCGLTGLDTSYRDVTVTDAQPQRLELRVTASQPPASLLCAGTVHSRTEPAGPTRLVIRLVRVGTEFRIASQRPGR